MDLANSPSPQRHTRFSLTSTSPAARRSYPAAMLASAWRSPLRSAELVSSSRCARDVDSAAAALAAGRDWRAGSCRSALDRRLCSSLDGPQTSTAHPDQWPRYLGGPKRDARGYETQFATNHLGHFQLILALLSALRAAYGLEWSASRLACRGSDKYVGRTQT